MKLTSLINGIGLKEGSQEFNNFLHEISHIFTKESPEYDDITYYSFFQNGIEIGVSNSKLKHIHCFILPKNKYSACHLDLELESLQLFSHGSTWNSYIYHDKIIRVEYNGDKVTLISIFNRNFFDS